ncbi:MAG: ROK family protein [Bradymonadaceae bacterium]
MTIYAGFDVGGTNARLSIYNQDWSRLASSRVRIRDSTRPEEVAQTLEGLLEELFEESDADPADLHSVGLGVAGQMSLDGEIVVNGPNLGWRDVHFADLLRKQLDSRFGSVHVRVVNDLSALLWGERQEGAVKGCDDVLAVYVGTGIGGAILAHGRIIDGAGGKAGEIGHSKVAPGGRLCGCGQRGCVEAYAGGVHLERQVAEIAEAQGLTQVFRDEKRATVDLATADRLTGEYEALDALWDRSTDYLAVVLANACTLLNPGVLLLGGGVLSNCKDFRVRTLSKTTPLILEAARDDMEIRFPSMGDDAGVLGAALLAVGSP